PCAIRCASSFGSTSGPQPSQLSIQQARQTMRSYFPIRRPWKMCGPNRKVSPQIWHFCSNLASCIIAPAAVSFRPLIPRGAPPHRRGAPPPPVSAAPAGAATAVALQAGAVADQGEVAALAAGVALVALHAGL